MAEAADAPDAKALCALFEALFLETHNTRLMGGGEEPHYVPADAECPHARIVFRHDYAASALHEVAHWCIAGEARRRLPDYGYWYAPDGRDAHEQCEFERVEARPQALEWIFSDACGLAFRPSIDNLAGPAPDSTPFCIAIAAAAREYCVRGLPARAAEFQRALCARPGRCAPPGAPAYTSARLLQNRP